VETHDVAQADHLAVIEEERRLKLAEATKEQIAAQLALSAQLRQAQRDQPLKDRMAVIEQERKVRSGELSKEDAIAADYLRAHPGASDSVVKDAAKAERDNQLRQQFETPFQKFQQYARDVQEATKKGILSPDQARLDLQREADSMMGPRGESGKFSEASSRSEQIQSALNEQANMPRLTYEEMHKMYESIEKLRSEGISLRA
jgi:hypothetical protein